MQMTEKQVFIANILDRIETTIIDSMFSSDIITIVKKQDIITLTTLLKYNNTDNLTWKNISLDLPDKYETLLVRLNNGIITLGTLVSNNPNANMELTFSISYCHRLDTIHQTNTNQDNIKDIQRIVQWRYYPVFNSHI